MSSEIKFFYNEEAPALIAAIYLAKIKFFYNEEAPALIAAIYLAIPITIIVGYCAYCLLQSI